MRQSLLGALLGAVLVIAATAGVGSSEPANMPPVNSTAVLPSGQLIAHVIEADGQAPLVTVIDPQQRVMAVYQLDRGTGRITPVSVRNFTWDLQMIQFNSGEPLPQDIRSGLQR